MAATNKTWVNGLAPTCEDVDLNGFKNENNNLIIGSGQLINTGDNQQTHKAVSHYSATGDFYVDSGTAAAYVLSVTGVQVAPPTYATGMRIRFVAGNTNSIAPTVNVAGLGVKDLRADETGLGLPAGAIASGRVVEAYYDGTFFRMVNAWLHIEHGVWTPTIEGASGGSGTVNVTAATYMRVGRTMTVQGSVNVTSVGTMVGAVRIANLPNVLGASSTRYMGVGAVRYHRITMTGYLSLTAYCATFNPPEIGFYKNGDAIASASLNTTDLQAGGNSQIHFSVTYDISDTQ